ncbi:MAG: hypothetical protein M3Q08_07230 [Pseudomonadota bacterium]|nr:hypothetical protein [Pseudomonadota bacterium]
MIPVLETSPGVFEPIEGNPVMESLHEDEAQRHCAPLATLLHPNWTDAMRAEFGVFLVAPVPVPAGHVAASTAYQRANGVVTQVHTLAPFVPQQVAPLQMRKAIRHLGLKATVDGYVSTVTEEKRGLGICSLDPAKPRAGDRSCGCNGLDGSPD